MKRRGQPWMQGPGPGAGAGSVQHPRPRSCMVDGSDFDDAPSGLPDWLSWVQLGLTTMLVVLFTVMLSRGREQSGQLRALEARLEGLEKSRALALEPILEKQMQSIIQRLEQLEGEGERLEELDNQQKQLEQEILRLRGQVRGVPGSEIPAPPAPAGLNPMRRRPPARCRESRDPGRSGPPPRVFETDAVLRRKRCFHDRLSPSPHHHWHWAECNVEGK